MQTRITSCRSMSQLFRQLFGREVIRHAGRAPSSGYEKARRRRALRRACLYPRLSIRRASLGPSHRRIHRAKEYALVVTDAKPGLPGFRAAGAHASRGRGSATSRAAPGRPLVLVHGLGGAASNWRLIAPALAEERRVIVPELPGHGGSGRLCPRRSTLDPFAEAVLAVLEAEDALPAPWLGPLARRPRRAAGCRAAARGGDRRRARRGGGDLLRGPRREGDGDRSSASREPGRLFAWRRRAVARSRVGRTVAFGWWGVADPAALDPEMAEAFLAGPAEHTDTLAAGKALVAARSAARPRPRHVSVPLPLGRERQLGAAPGRDGVRTPAARAAAVDRRLRPPADRRAAGRRPPRDARVPRVARVSSPRPPRTGSPPPPRLVPLRAAEELDSAARRPRPRRAARRPAPTSGSSAGPRRATRRPLARYSAQSSA